MTTNEAQFSKTMESKYETFLGDYLPDYVRPLVVVATTTVNIAITVLEVYILVPGSGAKKRRFIAEHHRYKIDLSSIPVTVISFDSIFDDGVDFSAGKIELEFYRDVDWQRRNMLLAGGHYTLHKVENHRLFRFKWDYGFASELRQISGQTKCQRLKDYLDLVNKVEILPPEVKDPFAE